MVGIGSTQITVNDVSNVQGSTLIKINKELLKVTQVGVGATNVLNVIRGQLGTVAAAHTESSSTNVMSGTTGIHHGNLHFIDPPYGPAGIGSLTTKSTFSGRVFYRQDYTKNLVMDDISEEFGDRIGNNLKPNSLSRVMVSKHLELIPVSVLFSSTIFSKNHSMVMLVLSLCLIMSYWNRRNY